MKVQRSIAALAAVALGLTVTACSSGDSGDNADGVTIEWWHIQTSDEASAIWQGLADEFEAENPGVTVDITVQDGTSFRSALDARIQGGDVPDLFQVWAGAGMQNQIDAGAIKDITEPTESWVDGLAAGPVDALTVDDKRYGIPYNAGLIGFWYNKALFSAAGIDAPPATWDEMTADLAALKDSGTTPIAVAGFEKFPLMFYWAQLALRIGGADAVEEAVATGDFEGEAFVQAGEMIRELVDAGVFQEGFIATPFAEAGGEASLVANGQAAMDLMGQWAPASMKTVAENGVGLGEDLGWFPFPVIDGGEGEITDGFGAVDGFAVGADAPEETLKFLEFISSPESARKVAAGGELLPASIDSGDAVTDPNMKLIAEALSSSTTLTNVIDQSLPPAAATALNENIAGIFAGTLTPEQAAAAITQAAKAQ